jgi:hypothetical protein
MKFEVTNPKAWKAVNEKNMPMTHKIKVYEKLGGAYRLGENGGEQVFNKMTELLKHRMQENDDNSSPEETLAGLKDMAMGNLERIADYANMIETRMKEGQELDSWMYSQLTVALENLNSVHDAMDGDDGEREPMKEVAAKSEGERIQNLNNRIKVLRDKLSATKSPEQKKLFQDRLKNALQTLSNIKKDFGIKKEISNKTPKIFVKTAAVEKKIRELMADRKKAVVPYNTEKDPAKKEKLKQILIKLTQQIQGYEKNLIQLRDMEEEYLQQMHADAELDTSGL